MAAYDLTQRMIPYLDRHLAIPLLAHLSETHLFPAKQLQEAQYELARRTNMVDYSVTLFEQLHPDEEVPEEFTAKRSNIETTNDRLQKEAQVVLEVIENRDVAQAMRQDKMQNLTYLREKHNLMPEQINALYHFGQFQYTYGNYSGAAQFLYHFLVLSTDPELNLSAQWGKLASDILSGSDWQTAKEELDRMREAIDNRASPLVSNSASGVGIDSASSQALGQLQSRTWYLHWSLFVYFNHPEGRHALLEVFLSPAYLNTIQTSCPWILRYLAAASVISRKTATSGRIRHSVKEVVRVIQMENYQYHDPITDFLKMLYVDFDFEAAQRELGEAERLIENDVFLQNFKDEFLDNARYFISEAYCRIHRQIDIADLSARLNLSREEGEKWIVNLIRDTRMGADAKIDLSRNIIVIEKPFPPVYQSVIERTRGLSFRTQALGVAMQRRAQGEGAQQGKEGGERRGRGERGERRERRPQPQEGRETEQVVPPTPAPVEVA
ncbi:eukaryotic translation initiation factor 3 subunit 6 [Dacryopinax primogenitus]|uniref:Eukaryotic translation initiation factor 3 subunit E n=1 Tax=Dacryopinax primogenitus (strain DJM 731) TaxID=1858805 RepID=M5FSG4_DACPD|nr:eukaryotic translation initiation factor 3 subunit 6 [Dacryopinax primogenitus]EJT98808.1 eukaryotic translation initiation factor 3 subunit 6 [Dacryopinax primogenitus]